MRVREGGKKEARTVGTHVTGVGDAMIVCAVVSVRGAERSTR